MLTLRRLLAVTRLGEERGQALPIVASAIFALMFMFGVVTDGGNLFQNKQSLQNAADASAIAAAWEVVKGHCTVAAPSACGTYAGIYAGMNSANLASGTSPSQTALPACTGSFSDTKPPAVTPCYVYPYNPPLNDEVEVWFKRKTKNFFGKLFGITTSTESARAVASLGPGSAPKVNFASLFDGCNNHTLLIKAGGTLTVNQTIYTNSCNVPNDAFDVFGGGSIRAPEIDVVGGWETHNNSTVFTSTGTPPKTWPDVYQCPLVDSKNLYHAGPTWSAAPNGCPIDGKPIFADPFAALPAPTKADGSPPDAATGTSSFVTHKGRQSNVATLVTDPALPVYVGSTIAVNSMDDSSFNTLGASVTSTNGNLFSYNNTGPNVPPAAVAQATVLSGNIANYLVTLNLSSGVSLCTGDAITVQNVDAIANGTFAVLSVNGSSNGCNSSTTKITYKDTNTGTSRTYTAGGTTKFTGESLANCDQAATCTATMTGLNVAPSVQNGDEIDVSNVTDEPTFDGTYAITGSTGTTVSYRPAPFVMTFQTDSITNGVATLHILGPDDPPASLANGTKATINVASNAPSGDSRFDGTFTVQSSSPTNDTITYNLPSISTTGYTAANGSSRATVNTASATGLQTGDTIKVTIGGAPGCLAGGHNYTVVSSIASSVTYTVASNCVGSNTTATGTIVIQSASGDDVAGTAQVKSNDATPTNGSIVVTPVDKTFTVGGTSKVSVLTVPTTNGCLCLATVVNTGTAATPKPYVVPFGTVTLNPGTYYGGICIGAGFTTAGVAKDCTGTNCNTTATPSANVTLNPGIYYIAGGGFHVCGGSTLNAPHVLIYNTQDTGHSGAATAAYWKIGQVQINTTGIVTIGPQTDGLYSGMTIFQDRNLVLTHDGPTVSTDDCNAKSGKPSEWDIALESMGDPGPPNHALGGITGTVYAPKEYTSGSPPMGEGADFGLQVSGTTTLAVFTSCIFINGVNDVFNYSSDSRQLSGLSATLSG